MDTMIITGGAGFIGCNFVRLALEEWEGRVVVLDKLTYAGSLLNLEDVEGNSRYEFVKGDIADPKIMNEVFEKYQPTYLINFAAESHVDRSIDSPDEFIQTNVNGTFTLLQAALEMFRNASEESKSKFRFLHVSTDEVYGSLGETGLFTEETPYAPNSPYSASKASADHFVRAYFHTYGLPTIITNCSNNYGPYQFPEKLLPLMILNAVEGKKLPVYGDGQNIRDWLHVEDHCRGILIALHKGAPGEKYNIGGRNERNNLEVVKSLCKVLNELLPADQNSSLQESGLSSYEDLIEFVKDRPGHDRRYAIDATKIETELDWKAKYDFESGLRATIEWYLENKEWCSKIQDDNYSRERLGLDVEKC